MKKQGIDIFLIVRLNFKDSNYRIEIRRKEDNKLIINNINYMDIYIINLFINNETLI